MFLTAFLAWVFFDLEINALFLVALAICSSSMAIYYGVWEKDAMTTGGEGDADEQEKNSVQLVHLLSAFDDEDEDDDEEEGGDIDAREGARATHRVAAEYGEYESEDEEEGHFGDLNGARR
jgi:hypothetical protein